MTTTTDSAPQKPMAISSITSPSNDSAPIAKSSSSSSLSTFYSSNPQRLPHRAQHHHYSGGISAVNAGLVPFENFTPASGHSRFHAVPHQQRASRTQHDFSSSSSPESDLLEESSFSKRKPEDHETASTAGSSGDENITSCMNDVLVPALLSSSSSSSTSSSSSSSSPSPSNTGTLSLQERRQRNKTASAKYRAKKNQQHHEMRSVIHSLTKENDVLLRQLEQVKSENRQLKYVCDKLRSKMMAEKMLKKMLQQQQTKDHATQPISNSDAPTPTIVSGERPMEPMLLDESDSDSMYNEESDETYVSSVYDSKHV